MNLTRLIAVRHGETDWNAATRIQGHEDIGLNARGLLQAQRVAEALADEPLAAIYSSDLSRAHQTAQPLAQRLGLPVRPEPALRERHFGVLQGHTFEEVAQRDPEQAQRWRQRDPHWQPEGGESLVALRERVVQALFALARRHVGEQVLLVTHGGVLDAWHRAGTGLDTQAPRTWTTSNAAIHRFLWTPDSLTLLSWGDERHLLEASLDERTG
jgi:probable phosphoglycerate mutase